MIPPGAKEGRKEKLGQCWLVLELSQEELRSLRPDGGSWLLESLQRFDSKEKLCTLHRYHGKVL